MGHRDLAVLTWLRMLRCTHKIGSAGMEFLRQWGLTPPQLEMLVNIARGQVITQQELADELCVTKGNVSQMLEKLERDGFIQREQDGTSKRPLLTGKGTRVTREATLKHDEYLAEKFAGLSVEEQAELLTLLRKLDKSLE